MSDTQNKWVPVSERLPEDGRLGRLALCNGNPTIAYFLPVAGRWYRVPDDMPITNVTHWMDLPEPPTPPKPADPFEAWWAMKTGGFNVEGDGKEMGREAWNAAKEHYAKPKDYQRGFEDAMIAFESMVDRILEGKEDGTGKLEIPQLEKLRRVLLERLKPLPDFKMWAKAYCADGPYLAAYWHPIAKQLIHIDNARGIWNAAQGKSSPFTPSEAS